MIEQYLGVSILNSRAIGPALPGLRGIATKSTPDRLYVIM